MRWPRGAFRTQTISSPWCLDRYFRQGSSTGIGGGTGSAVWPSANLAIYIPFELDRPLYVTDVWWINGSAASAGNVDLGVYSEDGTRLFSTGSTVQSGVDSAQTVNIPDVLIGRGAFYLALAFSSAAGSIYRFSAGATGDYQIWGGLQQSSAFALPATATFASNTTAFIPWFGITGRLV